MRAFPFRLGAAALLLAAAGCSRTPEPAPPPGKHEHHPPHGGTPVVLGDEVYHLEFVRDRDSGTLQAYVLDGEMETFIRSAMPVLEVDAGAGDGVHILRLLPVANPATGETVGDTALFEATLPSVTIRGTTFTGVRFNFPKGNDAD
jgi:hypothetical protein